MGKKATMNPQAIGANLVNKNGAAASSNGLDTLNFSKIKCHVCHKVRGTEFYSNRQILKHRNTIHNPYIPGGRSKKDYATCKDCTASQVETLHCYVCTRDRPLRKFLNTQRSVAKPRCKGCVQYHLDTERIGEAPILDEYTYDSSDESEVDPDDNNDDDDVDPSGGSEEDNETADDDEKEDEPENVGDFIPVETKAPQKAPSLASVSRQMGSISLQSTSSGSSGTSTPRGWGSIGSAPSSRATPAQDKDDLILLDDDVNDNGGWETVRSAGKPNSAYRTPVSWASRAASGMATPANASVTSSRSNTTTSSGFASPSTAATSVSRTSTGREKWGKPAKLKPGDVVEDVWKSDVSRKNNWAAWGGQPKMVKPKKGRRVGTSDDEGSKSWEWDED